MTAMYETLTAEDGHSFQCWMHKAEGTSKGGLVIQQEIFGVTDQLKELAARYAALGYDVAIPALFDRQERDCVVPFDQFAKGRDLMVSADLEANMKDAAAAVKALGGKVAVMGFCWGGGLALRAAQVLDVACGISFYGTRLQSYLDKPLAHPMQGHFGLTDDHTPTEVLAEVQAAMPDFEMYMYEAGHAFANHHRPTAYVEAAAELAHRRAAEFMATHVG